MQITPSRSHTIEKILRDKNGQLIRATFRVYEDAGRIKARLLSAVVLEEAPALENKIFALPGFVSETASQYIELIQSVIVSPYFSNILYSSGSKPRAPTF